jgi:signal transduction histidine kinase
VAVGSLLIIFSLLGGLYYYKLRQKNLGLQLIQTKLIQDQHIEKIKSESQVRILNATIDGKESERKQIAETLHDSVSTLLSSANLHLRATQAKFNDNTPEEIDKTQKIIMEASQVIRSLSHTLVSSVLLKFGLEYAIKDMANKYSNSQIEIETNLGVIGRYQQNFEIKTYNIIQEFLNNILKHSKAEKALINLEEVKGELSLKISDDGIGFDKTKIKNKEGIGLNQIEARIQMMKGDFDVISSMNKGTIITVRLPILKKMPVH